eukprot:4373579-Prymnesium_polylepis.2
MMTRFDAPRCTPSSALSSPSIERHLLRLLVGRALEQTPHNLEQDDAGRHIQALHQRCVVHRARVHVDNVDVEGDFGRDVPHEVRLAGARRPMEEEAQLKRQPSREQHLIRCLKELAHFALDPTEQPFLVEDNLNGHVGPLAGQRDRRRCTL